jgi:hypothetical protein
MAHTFSLPLHMECIPARVKHAQSVFGWNPNRRCDHNQLRVAHNSQPMDVVVGIVECVLGQ